MFLANALEIIYNYIYEFFFIFFICSFVSVHAISVKKNLQEVDINFSGIIIEKTTINEVITKIGSTDIVKNGDASNSNTSVCYHDNKNKMIRMNSGEMGGGKIITSISVVGGDIHSNCTVFKKKNFTFTNKRGIRLNLTKREVKAILGDPDKAVLDNWEYSYSSKSNLPDCDGGWDITGTYKIQFKKGELISFSVHKITSC